MKMNEIMSRTTNADQIGSMKALMESIEELDDERGVYVKVQKEKMEPESEWGDMISCWITVPSKLRSDYNVESVISLLNRHDLNFMNVKDDNPHLDMERFGMMLGAINKRELMKFKSSVSESDDRIYFFIPDNGET